MRILHICLACFYKRNFGYQENVLPRAHQQAGHEVMIMAPAEEMVEGTWRSIDADYINEDGIQVHIIRRKKGGNPLESRLFPALRQYEPFTAAMESFMPDVIFIHGGQSVSLKEITRFVKRHPQVRLYIDQHGDYYNTPVKKLSSRVLAEIHGHYLRQAAAVCRRFWGTTQWRCQYLREVYRLPEEKIELLVMGGDDAKIHWERQAEIRAEIRQRLHLQADDFVVLTGGKIDRTKNIHILMQAVAELDLPQLKLIVFGNYTPDMEAELLPLAQNPSICYIGWIPADDVYDYCFASDLACFPGTHSVLWEQACACGIPVLVKDWEGMHHVDVGGNCRFLKTVSTKEIKTELLRLLNSEEKYHAMKTVALNKGTTTFSYREIAKKAIEVYE